MFLLDLRHYTTGAVNSRIWENSAEPILCVDRSDNKRTLLQLIRMNAEAANPAQTVLLPAGYTVYDIAWRDNCIWLIAGIESELFLYEIGCAETTLPILRASYCFCAPIDSARMVKNAVFVTLIFPKKHMLFHSTQQILQQNHITMLWKPQEQKCVCLRDYTLSRSRASEMRVIAENELLTFHQGESEWMVTAPIDILIRSVSEHIADLPIFIPEWVEEKNSIHFLMTDSRGLWYDTTYTLSRQRKLICMDRISGEKKCVEEVPMESTEYRFVAGLGICRVGMTAENMLPVQPIDLPELCIRLPKSFRTLHGYADGVFAASDGRCVILYDVESRAVQCHYANAAVWQNHILLY